MGTHKKINVCHLISGDLWAGAEVQMYTLVSSLKNVPELNVSAIVLNEGKLSAKLRRQGFKTTVIDETRLGFFGILKLAKKELTELKVDILHTHRYKENVLGALLKKKGTVPYLIQTVHGVGEPFTGIKMLKARFYSSLDLYYSKKYFDIIQTVSFDIQNKLRPKFYSSKLLTIHNAVNTEEIQPTGTVEEVRSELGIDSGDFVIGSAGRMVPVKGYDIFLEMAGIFLTMHPNTRFLLVGDGPQKEELERKAIEMNLENKVLFLGFREDIINIINCFDIFVVSSFHEGIPMVLLEAMALKKAIVASDVGGIKEIITDGVSGIRTEPGDARSLALACKNILADPSFRDGLQEGAAKRIKEMFSVDIQRIKILEMYYRVAGRQ